jgi:hypothetical protein
MYDYVWHAPILGFVFMVSSWGADVLNGQRFRARIVSFFCRVSPQRSSAVVDSDCYHEFHNGYIRSYPGS